MPTHGTGGPAATSKRRPPQAGNERDAFVATLRGNLWWIVAAAMLAAGVTYALQRTTSPVYRAETSLLITKTDPQGLPAGGQRFMAPRLSVETYASLIEDGIVAANEAREREPEGSEPDVDVAVEDAQQSAILRIGVRGPTPRAAQQRANAVASALIDWDLARARRHMTARTETLERQVAALEDELETSQRQGLAAAQLGRLLEERRQELQAVRASQQAAATPLDIVREAPYPRRPVAPRPTRNAVLAGMLTGLASLGVLLAARAVQRE